MALRWPFPLRSLKARLILSYLVIVGLGGLVTSLVGSYIVSTTIMTQAQRATEHDLAGARSVLQHELAARRQAVWLLADGLSARDGRPLPSRDVGTGLLERVRREVGFDFLTLTDGRGRVTYRVSSPAAAGAAAADLAVVRAALRGEVAAAVTLVSAAQLAREDTALAGRAWIRLVPTANAAPTDRTEQTDGLALLAAAPLRDPAGAVRGVVYGGVLLNRRFELVDRVWSLLYRGEQYRRETVGAVSVFQRDVRIATTMRTEAGERAVGTRLPAEVTAAVLGRGTAWRGRAYVLNDWYIAAYDPLRDLDGVVVGGVYVGVLERTYASTRDRVILSFFGLLIIGFLLIIGLTYAIISNITRPVGEMVAATRNIAAGRLDQEVQATGQGEIALLAESFNTMLAGLRRMHANQEEWGRTLEEKVRQRTDEVTQMQVRVAQSERLASLGMLAAGVAHEINNPLGGILALTALALEDVGPDHPHRHNLEVVVRQTERCRDIVRGLLEFSRQSDATMEELDINAVLQQTLGLVSKQSAFFNVEIVQEPGTDLPRVNADRQQIQQVVLNLLLNAVQAMGERGTITIVTRKSAAGDVEILIRDTGCGIPRDVIDRIFDPFFTTKSGGQGTGLGLAIVYGIITRHRGSIGVTSEVGKGTTFTIRLPAHVEVLVGAGAQVS
jgi:two-component system NtrC family sensor kinase